LLALQTLNTLLLILLDSIHLLPDSIFFRLHSGLLFVLLGLTVVLIDALIEIIVFDRLVSSVGRQELARYELLQHLTLELLDDVLAIDSQDLLRSLLL